MEKQQFTKMQIFETICCIALAVAMLVVGFINFKLNWLKIVISVVLAIVLIVVLFFKIYSKENKK